MNDFRFHQFSEDEDALLLKIFRAVFLSYGNYQVQPFFEVSEGILIDLTQEVYKVIEEFSFVGLYF